MKLTDFRNFELLNSLKERMGIPRDVFGDLTVVVDVGRLSELELEKLTSQDGLEISIDDLRILDDGTLAYKNSRVLLYIRDVGFLTKTSPVNRAIRHQAFRNCSGNFAILAAIRRASLRVARYDFGAAPVQLTWGM